MLSLLLDVLYEAIIYANMQLYHAALSVLLCKLSALIDIFSSSLSLSYKLDLRSTNALTRYQLPHSHKLSS